MKMIDLMKQADREVAEVHRRLGVEEMGTYRVISEESVVVFALVAIALMAESESMLKIKSNRSRRGKIEAALGKHCLNIGVDDTEGVSEYCEPRFQ
jgi:hypothetical protein